MSDTEQVDVAVAAARQVTEVDTGVVAVAVQSLTIADCGPLYEQIKGALEAGQKVNLDLRDCDDVDTAGLQLLTAIQHDPEVSLKVRWSNVSTAVLEKAARLGLLSWVETGAVEV